MKKHMKFLPTNKALEAKIIYEAIIGWKSKLAGGTEGMFFIYIPKSIFSYIKKRRYSKKIEQIIISEIESSIRKHMPKVLVEIPRTEKKWRSIELEVNKTLQEIFNVNIPTVNCYLILSCIGGSYAPKKNKIYIFFKWANNIYIIAHELCHLYFYKAVKPFITKKNEKQIWYISEILANFILLRSDLVKFWPKQRENFYRQDKFAKELWPLWENRKSFTSFIKKATRI